MGSATLLRVFVLVAAPLVVAEGHADSVCEKGSRETTAAERQTMMGFAEVAKAALPPAPTGWAIGGYEVFSAIENICKDFETTPWAYSYTRIFNRTDDTEARDQALAEVGARLRARQEELRPRQEAIMAKMSALGGELGVAFQRGDQARAAAIQAEIEKVAAEFEALAKESEDPAALEAVASASGEDRTMSVAISVNAGTFSDRNAESAAATAGARAVYRWTTVDTGVETAHAAFLFGDWQPETEGLMRAGRRGTVSSAAAHNMVVTVEAHPGRIDSLLASINFPALAATLAR